MYWSRGKREVTGLTQNNGKTNRKGAFAQRLVRVGHEGMRVSESYCVNPKFISLEVELLSLGVEPLSLGVEPLSLGVEPLSLEVTPLSLEVEPLNLGVAPLSLKVAPLKDLITEICFSCSEKLLISASSSPPLSTLYFSLIAQSVN
ncbi:hypothetical protein [Nostoc sp. 'Peltigera malacea cyanobiont' DB3992]|uniref:hypothetical protein n=1 Tax=Nostoc sp. 'Peltigera malacea cyanobiont' DB3992 TaxID=1206980 RepID=UPI000C055628|nr:hypothetical protein [Nostoc sp. 'Peltigera malacea cyanobiont' DB3992]PHM10831.1 hypothetical protein CK516_06335 [Nostoc sp. 'Peltigera malacea cyanobiont' DB3992]